MEKSTLKILIASVAIVAGVSAAYAQDRGPRDGGMTFEELDVDGSGEITTSDVEALRTQRFAAIDTDGDGSVTESEFIAHTEARAGERAAEMFARMDADGDGILSRDALESRRGRVPFERMLSRLDGDNSGGINAEEFEEARERFAERRGGKRGERGMRDR